MADNIAIKDGAGASVTLRTTDITTAQVNMSIPTNASGTAAAFGTGARGATVPRVTIATDDLVPVTGTLTAVTTVSTVTNLAQIAGAAPAFGSGANGATVLRVGLATDSPGVIATAAPGTLSAAGPSVTAVNPSNYETVAASQTAQALGASGATGDFINGLLVVPATTSPGNVLLLDNATSITVFTGGATSVSNLVPFFIPLGMTSVSGAWKVTTGSNVSVIGVGKFT